MLTIKQAAHLQGLIDNYTLAEYEQGHYTAVAYCTTASPAQIEMAKRKLRGSPACRLHDLLMKELRQLTDWSKV